MINEEPDIKLPAVYNVSETCAILQVSRGTLRDRRVKGYIVPVNPYDAKGYRYTGEAIRKLWRFENHLN